MKTLSFKQDIPIRHEVDVCIAGGGAAGVAAAVAASRAGASVFLAEASGCFGGLGTAGLVPAFCGVGNGTAVLGGPFCREVLKAMDIPSGAEKREFSYIDAEKLKCVYDDFISSSGCLFALEVRLAAVVSENGNVEAAVFTECGRESLFAVKARVYIDATGNGDLAAWAGADYAIGNAQGIVMPSTLCTAWTGMDWAKYDKSQLFDQLLKAVDDGVFSLNDWHHSGMFPVGKQIAGGNFGHIYNLRADLTESRTAGWLDIRRRLKEFQKFYREYVPGFQQAELVASASLMGVRECRRITGDYILTVDDFKNKSRFEDEIGVFAYGVDIHPLDDTREEFDRFRREFYGNLRYKEGECYGVPYRVLIPSRLKNVLTAGRCVSTDQPMEASIRVMPGCFLTGYAAGTAAALAPRGDVRAVTAAEIRKKMFLQ
ncbi:MAG: FAD-dependent oxidoreductase [Lentisphaeria bacterium]|nr:FAD-dependent oxidoreductase [Lentisphaeria bacterium]